MPKIALITGITGQDGAYLSEFLLKKGYIVHGIKRRTSLFNTDRIDHIYQDPHIDNRNFILHYGDLTDSTNLIRIIQEVQPDEIYNLGAMSHVRVSFEVPEYVADTDGIGTLRLLEAIRILGLEKKTKIYQASTSELYGKVQEVPQKETTPFYPRSPYAVAKMYAYWITVNYREAYGMFACNGILFNHEGPLRGETFVTRKITRGVAKIALGLQDKLWMGNINSKRDWGHAKDYCIDLDTTLLTTSGFKRREDLQIGDTIINYNLNTSLWEHDKIVDIHDVPFEGEMYIFSGNNLSFRCSENHRLFYKRKTHAHKMWNDLRWKESTAKEIYDFFEDISIRAKYDFCFPGFDGLTSDQERFDIDDNLIKLIGYLVTEGSWSFSKEIGRGSTISVSQSKKKYFDDLKQCIDDLKLEYRLRERADEVCEVIFSAEARDFIIDYFDSHDIHQLPAWIYKLSKKQLEILFNAMMNGDGAWSSMVYVSKNRKLAHDFKNIAALIGHKTSFRKRKSGMYEIVVFSKSKKSINNFITTITKETVSENIWCVTTEKNGTIITQKDNTVFISGNCEAMYLILQQDKPEDFVIATGKTTEIREFIRMAFAEVGVEIEFKGEGVDEKGYVAACHNPDYQLPIGKEVLAIDPKYFRPTEVDLLLGDPTKAMTQLGWKPKYDVEMLCAEMVAADIELFKKEKLLKEAGFEVKNQFE